MHISEMSLIGDKALGFTQYNQIADLDFEPVKPDEKPDERVLPDNLIFDEIFAVNPVTKLPDGDIACFMNENTSEAVRNFIIQNLTNDNGSMSDASGDFSALDDDTIALYTRNSGESVSQYRDRIISYIKDYRSHREKGDNE